MVQIRLPRPEKQQVISQLNQLACFSTIRRAQKSNDQFVQYVVDMGLRIRTDNGVANITPDNLLYYQDNERYLNGEVLAPSVEKAEVDRKIREIETKIEEDDARFHVDRVDTSEFDRQIASLIIKF